MDGDGKRSSSAAFEREVERCADDLNRLILVSSTQFSGPALATALAIHAVRALSGCVERDEITPEHARTLIEHMAELRFPHARRSGR